ncbi:hypothetical protein MSC49_15190 [Methylosinus sp. C49]|uniref:hypothetical protein n=1 Tax=Methylosinus sp. C49 TaxID=2699395 RepID=UPI0013668A46|nr:hypothetical protein [Methylosinus sp. C49]BBU61584.1 hypothetical protein MSC49_15190 [Methylosinus sp. C49]
MTDASRLAAFPDSTVAAPTDDAWSIDREIVIDLYAEAKRKTAELRKRLVETMAAPHLLRSIEQLEKRLGGSLEDVRIGLLLSSFHSLEADRRAYGADEGRKELACDLLAMLDDTAKSVRALLSVFSETRRLEREGFGRMIDNLASAITRSDVVMPEAAAPSEPTPVRKAEIAAISDQVHKLAKSMQEYREELRSYAAWAKNFN